MTSRRVVSSQDPDGHERSGRSIRSRSQDAVSGGDGPVPEEGSGQVGGSQSKQVGQSGEPTESGKSRKRRRPKDLIPSRRRSGRKTATTAGQSSPRTVRSEQGSQADDFVDARVMPSDQAVSNRIGVDQDQEGMGVFVRPKVIDFEARVNEKKSVSRRVILIRAGVTVLVLALISALVWLLFISPVFRLQAEDIEVSGGNAWVANEKVESIVREQGDRSLMLVSTKSIEEDIGGMAGVTEAQVHKHFPHGLDVTFKAQEPTAILKDSQGTLTAVDRKGRVLNTVDKPAKNIPIIQVANLERGKSDRTVKQTLRILSSMPEDMRHSVTKVTADTQDSITTELNKGERVIIWGDGSDLKLKLAVVDKIINDPSKIGDKHQLDVSAPLRPIVK